MLKNIVFDIGNVLVDYRPKEYLAAKGFSGEIIKRIIKASILSPYWEQFERAAMTNDEVMKAFVSQDPGIEKELYEAYSNIHGMLTIRDFAVSWVKALKDAGYHVYYLSNYSQKAYDDCRDSLAFMEHMEGGLLSFQARMTKPDPAFYQLFLKQFGLAADDCVFIDDTEQNVLAARDQGFTGIVFQSCEDTVLQLAALGIVTE